jgi:hypothetical protein
MVFVELAVMSGAAVVLLVLLGERSSGLSRGQSC